MDSLSTPSTVATPSDDSINQRLRDLILDASSEALNLTPKQIREQLSGEFNYDMNLRKEMIKSTLNELIAELHESGTLAGSPSAVKKTSATAKKITRKPPKTLKLSQILEEFCRSVNPSFPQAYNMTHVRACIVQYVKEKELKDPRAPRQFILDETLSQRVFPGNKKCSVKFFDIYKALKASKQYSYWM